MFYIKKYIRKLSQFSNVAVKATRKVLTCDTTRAQGKTSASCAQHSTVQSSGKKKERLHRRVTTRRSTHSIGRGNHGTVWRILCRQAIGRCETSRTHNNIAIAWCVIQAGFPSHQRQNNVNEPLISSVLILLILWSRCRPRYRRNSLLLYYYLSLVFINSQRSVCARVPHGTTGMIREH